MPAPTVVGSATSAWNASAVTTLTINKPTGVQDGDYLVAFLRAQSAGATADWTSSGWSRISFAFAASQAGPRLIGIYALPVPSAASLGATSFTFTFTGTTSRVIGTIAIVRGVDLTSPVVATSPSYGGTNITNGTRITGYTNSATTNALSLGMAGGELVAGNTNAITITSSATVSTIYTNDTANDGTSGTTGSRTAIIAVSYPGLATTSQVDIAWGTVASPGSEGVTLRGLSSNAAPTAAFGYSTTGLQVSVDGTTSSDSDGSIVSYDWDWGDGTTHGTGATTTHTYATATTYTVALTVTDNGGATGNATSSVTVTAPSTRPTIVGTPTYGQQTVTTAHNVVIAKPAGVADGDWLIASLRSQDATATVDFNLSGWTRVGNSFTSASAASRIVGFYAKHIATASAETATSYTFSWTGGDARAVGMIFRVQGADPVTLVDAYSTPYSTTGITNGTRLASYSVPDSNGLQLAAATNEQTSPNASETVSHTAGYNFVASVFSSSGTGSSRTTLELYQKGQDAGPTTQMDVTWAAVSSPNIQSIVLKGATGSNIPPTAGFTAALSSYTVTITSSATDSDGTIASYDYDWGDSTSHATTASPTHTYASAGIYTITQTVTDNSGATSTVSESISAPAGLPPVPHFGAGDSTTASSAGAATLAGSKPTNTANGDLLVAYVYSQNTSATVSTVPTGWTLAASYSTRSGGIYTKPIPTASAEVATSYTWALSGSGRLIINIFRVTGADLTNPIDVAGTQAAEVGTVSSYSDTSVTTNYPSSLLLGFNFWNNSSTTVTTVSAPSSMSAGDQISSPTTGNTSGTFVGYQALATVGVTGTRAFGYSPAPVNGAGLMLAIKRSTPNPVASFTTSSVGQTLSVNGSASAATSGATITGYDWDWGDSTTHGTGATTTHGYAARGTYTVTLTVTDSAALTGSQSRTVTITDDGYAGIWRDSGGVNHPGVLYYWDGTAKHPFGSTLINIFNPYTVTQFLSATHSPWFSAHRGFSYSYPEETLYGYRGATDYGIKAIEISAQMSASGTWWCFHDATTDRTTGVSGTISAMTDAQISVLNNQGSTATANPGQPARPTAKLTDVLDQYYKTHVIIIEDKTYSHTTAMLNLMDSYGTSGRPATEIFIWKVASSSSKTNFFDPAAARGYHRWAYIFDSSMSTEFPALPASGKADMIGMDYNSSDATLSSAIALCISNGVMPTGHIINSTTQRDRMLGLGMKGLMMSSKDAIPPWYNTW
ncbi:MAG: hypothetical protein JWO99_652 [Candidatus Saccharibacteria bacterium]|nr:hypothetical protein [Candidatus Saccharibacteria bacterium]